MKYYALIVAAAFATVPFAAGLSVPLDEANTTVNFIVGFHDEPTHRKGDFFYGGEVTGVNDAIDFITVATEDPEFFETAATNDVRVRYVERDYSAFHTQFTPDDPKFGNQWGFGTVPGIDAELAWDVTLGSTSTIVAVLDTGLEKSHEDIGNYLQGYDFAYDDSDPADGDGHGTHVSGTVGALTNNGVGVAGTAQTTILPVKVLDDGGSGSFSDVAAGITYATDNGADIISMSLGCSPARMCGSQAVDDALQYAVDNGVLNVCAAGNDGPKKDSVGYPAVNPNCMAVSALTSSGDIAFYSSRGKEVEIAAPGSSILSTYIGNSYDTLSGTSMATPHVSGVGALTLAVKSLTGAQLRDHLKATAVDLGLASTEQGAGAVNAANAVS